MKQISPETANRELKKHSDQLQEKDLYKVLQKEQKIEDKFRNNASLTGYFTKAKSLLSLIKDYWNGTYPEVPWKTLAAAGGALLYVLMPLDLIPDFIPIVGLLDDAGVVAACLKLVTDDLVAYEKWKAFEKE